MTDALTTPPMKMVAFFTDGSEARAAQGALADENIPCILVNSRSGPDTESIEGFRMLVALPYAERAEALLEPNLSVYFPEEDEPSDEIIRTHGFSWYVALFLTILAAIGFASSFWHR